MHVKEAKMEIHWSLMELLRSPKERAEISQSALYIQDTQTHDNYVIPQIMMKLRELSFNTVHRDLHIIPINDFSSTAMIKEKEM